METSKKRTPLKIIRKLIDNAICESIFSSFKNKKRPGEWIENLTDADREILKDLTQKDIQDRI